MSWAIVLLLALGIFGVAALVARPRRGAIELLAAALLLGLAGYAWQGSPRLPGRPTPPRANHPADNAVFAQERAAFLDRVGPEAQALDSADALTRNGSPDYALGIMRGAVVRSPRSLSAWTGLGNALVTYADGSVTPAARYAFGRAAALDPANPGPAYFLALAYAQSGDLGAAEKIWRAILAAAPPGAPYRPLIEQKLAILAQLRAAG